MPRSVAWSHFIGKIHFVAQPVSVSAKAERAGQQQQIVEVGKQPAAGMGAALAVRGGAGEVKATPAAFERALLRGVPRRNHARV